MNIQLMKLRMVHCLVNHQLGQPSDHNRALMSDQLVFSYEDYVHLFSTW